MKVRRAVAPKRVLTTGGLRHPHQLVERQPIRQEIQSWPDPGVMLVGERWSERSGHVQEHSEFEREMLETARLVRHVIYGVGIVIGAIVLFGIAVAVLGWTVGGSSSSGGMDIHGALGENTAVETRTEAGKNVRATVTNLSWAQGPVLTVRIQGGEPESLAADAWTFVLTDGQVLGLRRLEEQQPQTYRFWLDGSLPAGGEVRFVHFNPDSSHGDIYFDVKK